MTQTTKLKTDPERVVAEFRVFCVCNKQHTEYPRESVTFGIGFTVILTQNFEKIILGVFSGSEIIRRLILKAVFFNLDASTIEL
jgi:hypothetical protein